MFYVDAGAASLQAALLPSMNVFFYLDRRREVLATVAILTVLNIVLTLVSFQMGAAYYGYGYGSGLTLCSALLIAMVLALRVLEHNFSRLEYETFMLQ